MNPSRQSLLIFSAFLFLLASARSESILDWTKKSWSFQEFPLFQKDFQAFKGDFNSLRDSEGKTPLYLAAQRGHHDVATLLLLNHTNPDAGDLSGKRPVHMAAERGHDFMIRQLFLKGADIQKPDSEGYTPLAWAIKNNQLKCAEVLLSLGAKTNPAGAAPEKSPLFLVEQKTTFKELLASYAMPEGSPAVVPGLKLAKDSFQTAAKRGDFETVLTYIQQGKDINSLEPGPNGATALHRAIQGAYDDMVLCLLIAGADPNTPDAKGKSPMMWTMGWHGFSFDRMRDYLWIKGARNNTVSKEGWTELGMATSCGNLYGMQMLIALGEDPKFKSAKGTPLELAFNIGDQRGIDLLRANGVQDPLPVNSDPVWNLHNATKRGDLEKVKSLVQGGLSIDSPAENGDSPLMNAIGGRQLLVAKWLIENGADINFQNSKSGWTPVHVSVIWDYHELTLFREELLKMGANVNTTSKNGQTPLMRAIWHEPTTPFLQLLKYGADIHAKTPDGKTMVDLAVEKGCQKTADYLRKLEEKPKTEKSSVPQPI